MASPSIFFNIKKSFFSPGERFRLSRMQYLYFIVKFLCQYSFYSYNAYFFYHRASSFTATTRGQPSGTRGPPTCFKRFFLSFTQQTRLYWGSALQSVLMKLVKMLVDSPKTYFQHSGKQPSKSISLETVSMYLSYPFTGQPTPKYTRHLAVF